MTTETAKPKQTVIFTKRIEVVCRRRTKDEAGKPMDEAVYVHLNRMDDLRALRSSFVKSTHVKEGDLHEVPNYTISDQLFLFLAERMKLAQIVDMPEEFEPSTPAEVSDDEEPAFVDELPGEPEESAEEQETEEVEEPEEEVEDAS